MKAIAPHLWFNTDAEEAVRLYTSAFSDSTIKATTRYNETASKQSGLPEGSVMTMSFQLAGQDFLALNGGPYYKFSPAVSFFVSCDDEAEVDAIWDRLTDGGVALMPRSAYPFSKYFGWLQDKFGVSWQLNAVPRSQKIAPALMFVGDQHGNADPAMKFYVSLFPNSDVVSSERYGPGDHGVDGTIKQAVFRLNGQEFMAMDSHFPHQFGFTGAISLLVNCETQEEIDALWAGFSEGGHEEQCGWIRDRYGVYWQVTPAMMGTYMSNPKTAGAVMRELLTMKKIDMARLQAAAQP